MRFRAALGITGTGVGFQILSPRAAEAHLMTTGLGSFYDGIVHLALTPDDLLAVLALALLAGLCGRVAGRTMLIGLPVAWLLGGILGLTRSQELLLPVATSLSLLLGGGLVALGRRLPRAAVTGLAVSFGLFHGFLNGTAMAEAGGGIAALLGIALTVFALVALVAALVISLRWGWARIAIRVAGSWITAIALLMLGWAVRGT